MTYEARIAVIAVLSMLAVAGILFVPPIPQDPAYHLFADIRGCLGVPNCGDVVSNAPFVVVGAFGLVALYGPSSAGRFDTLADTAPYAIFFVATLLIGAGSAYYHWRPDNQTLFWDRLPMTLGFMAMTAAVIADRIHRKAGLFVTLPILLALGVGSLIYWDWSERIGQGDLRFYGLVQFLPLVLIPVICWLFPTARFTKGKYIAAIVFWYALAKLFEHFDAQIFELLGHQISGHTLKHLFAAVATAYVIPMVTSRSQSTRIGAVL